MEAELNSAKQREKEKDNNLRKLEKENEKLKKENEKLKGTGKSKNIIKNNMWLNVFTECYSSGSLKHTHTNNSKDYENNS